MQENFSQGYEFTGENNLNLSMRKNLATKNKEEEQKIEEIIEINQQSKREIAKFHANYKHLDEAIQEYNKLRPFEADIIFRGLKQAVSLTFQNSSTKETATGLVDKFKKYRMKYTDYEFPGTLRSLVGIFRKQDIIDFGNSVNWDDIIWLRPEEIYTKAPCKLFSSDLGLFELKQGILGNSYFMACIFAIGNQQNRIRDLFLIKEMNEQGIHCVKLNDFGTWKTITVDDYIPCDKRDRQPFSYKSRFGDFWVPILEKAWAKLNGTFYNMEIGSTKEFFRALTGAPVKSYRTENPNGLENLWKDLIDSERNGYAATCGGGESLENANLIDAADLIGSLPYIIQRAFEIKEKKDVFRFVKLHNPWGQGEWSGWNDINLNPDVKARLQNEPLEPNSFFMPYQEFVRYFTNVNICRVIDTNLHASVQIKAAKNHATYFKITINRPGIYYLTVSQKTIVRRSLKDPVNYNNIVLLIGKYINLTNIEYVAGTQGTEKDVWTSAELAQGEYLVYVKIPWRDCDFDDFVLSSYGPGNPTITKVDKKNYPDILNKIFTFKGRSSTKKQDYEYFDVENCYRSVEFTDDGFSFIYYQNKSNKTLEEELYFKIFEGLKLRKPSRGRLVKVIVNPGEEKIIIAKQLPYAPKIRQAFTEKVRFV